MASETFIVTGTLKYNGRNFTPEMEVTIHDPQEAQRLLRLGAIVRPQEAARLQVARAVAERR